MTHSHKKTPIAGITKCDSEKQDKRHANRKLRAAVRSAVASGTEVLPEMRDVSTPWTFGKDGKKWVGGKDVELVRK